MHRFDETVPNVDERYLPRPCYYIHQILGFWHPRPKSFCQVLHELFGICLFVVSSVAVLLSLLRDIENSKKVSALRIVQAVSYLIVYTLPFAFTKFYFKRRNFDDLVYTVCEKSEKASKNIRYSSLKFTVVSVVLWILVAMNTACDWKQLKPSDATVTLYVMNAIYFSATWACWISLFGFVCSVHRIQAEEFVDDMKEIYRNSDGSEEEEKRCIAELITLFHTMQKSWKRTGKDFGLIISLSVASHVFDIIIFTCCFWGHEIQQQYSLYFFALFFDFASVILIVYPAGKVVQAAHSITKIVGKHCRPIPNVFMPEAGRDARAPRAVDTTTSEYRIRFLRFLSVCEESMGFKIVGIRISLNVALVIVVTIVMATVSFTAAVIPRLAHLSKMKQIEMPG